MPKVSLIISTCHFCLTASAFVSVSPGLRTTREPTNHLEPAGQANFCWRFSRHHVIRIWKDRHLNLIKFHLSLTTVPQWWSVEHWQSQKSCLVVYYPEIWLGLLLSNLKLNTIRSVETNPPCDEVKGNATL